MYAWHRFLIGDVSKSSFTAEVSYCGVEADVGAAVGRPDQQVAGSGPVIGLLLGKWEGAGGAGPLGSNCAASCRFSQ